MTTIDKIRNGLIDKLLTIENESFLMALDNLISSTIEDTNSIKLTIEQKEILEMSEVDIKEGRLISQEAMDKRNLEWLSGL
ncbi:MAG: hypothetical protein M9887_00990 [Chitinophagales bacterium]|nr:hypothetical protein [Chitinophagales bacterium]